MNVRCPSCETSYRVDPTKVPEQGVQACCAECSAVISVVKLSDPRSASTPAEGTGNAVDAGTFAPEPLAAAEQVVGAFAEPTEQIQGEYGADAIEEPAPIEAPSKILPHEFADLERPTLSDAPVLEDELTLPDVTEPTEMVEPLPTYEEAVSEPPAADDIPLLPEVPSVVEAAPAHDQPLDELPPVPDPSAVQGPADIEKPAPEPEPTQPPALEIMPSADLSNSAQPRRYTRPFLRPSEEAVPSPPPAAAGPPTIRPTAPVFRPTPGMPIQTPPAPGAHQPVDAAPAPPGPGAPPPVDAAPAPQPVSDPSDQVPGPESQPEAPVPPKPAPVRTGNPFLSKDPKQKARRLARALVSDMIVYQPQKRQDALAAGTLKEAFDEEIKKSWQEYVEQIGNELAVSTEFFKEALNEILAGGNEIF